MTDVEAATMLQQGVEPVLQAAARAGGGKITRSFLWDLRLCVCIRFLFLRPQSLDSVFVIICSMPARMQAEGPNAPKFPLPSFIISDAHDLITPRVLLCYLSTLLPPAC